MQTRSAAIQPANPVANFLWTFLMGFSNSLPAECFVSGEMLQQEEKLLPPTTAERKTKWKSFLAYFSFLVSYLIILGCAINTVREFALNLITGFTQHGF